LTTGGRASHVQDMEDRTSYFVINYDETRGAGSGPSSFIPTLGAASTALDQYRTAGIHSTNLHELGAAFTDITAIAALAKVAEGGLASVRDLEAAETALQALLLHDIVHVVIHAPKVDYGTGMISYSRWDQRARSNFAFELMGLAAGRDFLVAPEFLRADGGVVVSATFTNSPLIGRRLDTMTPGYQYWSPNIADAINAAIAQQGIPAYLADSLLIKSRRGDGFAKNFYHRLRISWDKATEGIPPIECAFNVPPLLAIVLNRLNNRQDLKAVLVALREELVPVRAELREFSSIVTASTTQQEVARRVKRLNESFDAIMVEASLTSAERVQRGLALVQRLTRPIIKFMAGFVTKTGPSLDDLLGVASTPSLLVEYQSVVDRTVTARTFSGLVRVEAVHLARESPSHAGRDRRHRSIVRRLVGGVPRLIPPTAVSRLSPAPTHSGVDN
jgi:hypothetical protein